MGLSALADAELVFTASLGLLAESPTAQALPDQSTQGAALEGSLAQQPADQGEHQQLHLL